MARGDPPYNTKKDPPPRAALLFFSIINKSQGGHVHVREYTVYVMFRVQRGWFGGWFGLVWRFLVSSLFCLFAFKLHRRDTLIKCSNMGLVWGWFGVGFAWFVVGFAWFFFLGNAMFC